MAILACLAKKCVENAQLGTFQKITCLRVVAQVFQFIENGKGIFKSNVRLEDYILHFHGLTSFFDFVRKSNLPHPPASIFIGTIFLRLVYT